MTSSAQRPSEPRLPDLLALSLVALVTGFRLVFIFTNQLQLSADEMHYWDWSRRLDLAYYSKGPLLALLIRASTAVFGDNQLGVRLPAVILGAAFTSLIYLHGRNRIGGWNALLITGSVQLIPVIFGVGLAMNSDSPALVCWTVALIALAEATTHNTDSSKSALSWITYGLATAIGITAKYTLLILPAILIAAAPWHACTRPLLKQRWFWLGQLIALCGLIPVLAWNALHDWVNLAHNAGHLGLGSPAGIHALQVIRGPAELAGSQLLLFGPLTLPLLCLAAFRVVPAAWRHGNPYPLLLGWLGSAMVAIFLLVAIQRSVYANWPLPVGTTGIFLLIEAWPQLSETRPQRLLWKRRIAMATVVNAVLATLALLPFYGIRFGLTDRQLPTRKLAGWRELATELRRQHPQRLAAADLVVSDYYTTASGLAFGLGRQPGEVTTVSLGRRRMTQYDVWAPGDMAGRRGANALIVLSSDADPSGLHHLFESLEPLPDLSVEVNGQPFSRYQVWFGRHYNGSPLPRPQLR